MIMENPKIVDWVYFIRQFNDIAQRYPIHEPKLSGDDLLFGFLNITKHREFEEKFYNEVRKFKIEVSNDKLQFIYDDLKKELFKSIDSYFTWYQVNQSKIKEAKLYNSPYESMYSSMEATRNEVERINNRIEPKIFNDNKSEPTNEKHIEPIIWTSDNVLLGYLVQWLKENGLIAKKCGRDSIIKNHFVDSLGKPISNIKQGLQNMRDLNEGQLPKNYHKIEELLKSLKDAIN